MSKCRCDYCRGGRENRENLNCIEDYDDEPRYRKVPKKVKFCKKSKTKEPCDHTVKVTKWEYNRTDEYGRTYQQGYYALACRRCGKQKGMYSFNTRNPFRPFTLY